MLEQPNNTAEATLPNGFRWIGLDHIFDIYNASTADAIIPIHFQQLTPKIGISPQEVFSAAMHWGLGELGYRQNLAREVLHEILSQERTPIFPFISSHWVPISTPLPTGKYERLRAPYEISIYKPNISADDHFAQLTIARTIDMNFLGEHYKYRKLSPQFNTQTGELLDADLGITTSFGYPIWTQTATNETAFYAAIAKLHELMQKPEHLDVLSVLKIESPIVRKIVGLP